MLLAILFGFIDHPNPYIENSSVKTSFIDRSPSDDPLPPPLVPDTMLHKLLRVHKLARPSRPEPPRSVYSPDEESSSALKIVHAGGNVECYFMPIPAARIIDRYPSFYVTRPEVFRRPWEAVVGPDETLALGEKYYLVPRHTVNKLRRRTRRPSRDDRSAVFSASRPFNGADAMKRKDRDRGSSGSSVKRGGASHGSDLSTDFVASKKKGSTTVKHVRFRGIDDKPRKGPPAAAAVGRNIGKVVENARKGLKKKSQSSEEKKKVKVTPTWQPALASISEIYGSDE